MSIENLPKVSVVIPTHNRAAKLSRLLDSIEMSTLVANDREVIVVTDNCTDDTISLLANHYPNVKVIATPPAESNRLVGCATARHLGAKQASASIICFVDDDNVVAPDMLEVLANAVDSDPMLGAVGPLMMCWPEGTGIWCAGAYTRKRRFNRNTFSEKLIEDADEKNLLEPCDFLPNVFCTRASTLKMVPFDVVAFPHNGSEPDWGIRLKRAGFQLRVTIGTTTWHDSGYRSFTTRISQPAIVRDQASARIRLRRLHPDYYGSLPLFWLVWFPSVTVYLLIRFIVSGHFWTLSRAFVQGTLDGLRL